MGRVLILNDIDLKVVGSGFNTTLRNVILSIPRHEIKNSFSPVVQGSTGNWSVYNISHFHNITLDLHKNIIYIQIKLVHEIIVSENSMNMFMNL